MYFQWDKNKSFWLLLFSYLLSLASRSLSNIHLFAIWSKIVDMLKSSYILRMRYSISDWLIIFAYCKRLQKSYFYFRWKSCSRSFPINIYIFGEYSNSFGVFQWKVKWFHVLSSFFLEVICYVATFDPWNTTHSKQTMKEKKKANTNWGFFWTQCRIKLLGELLDYTDGIIE